MSAAVQSKAKKTASSKKPHSHPTFAEMIADAIVSLKERTGSSQYAITKFIEEKHKDLPPAFRKLLLHNLKKSVAAGKLVKVKNSFKLPSTRTAPVKAATAADKKPKAVAKPSAKAASKAKSKPAAKPKAVAAKPKAKAVAAVAKPKAKVASKKVAAKTLKKTPVKKTVKKPKSLKSPAKKVAAKKVVAKKVAVKKAKK